MTRPRGLRRKSLAGTARPAPRVPRRVVRIAVPLLLAFHAALVIPGMLRNSATFDENFHLPAGALYLARGYTHISIAQPPLARALFALPVMAFHPALPPDSLLPIGAERSMAASFVHLNAARFQFLLIVARCVGLLLSLLLGWLVFRFARERYGSAGGLLALAVWAALPDAVAHAGLVGVDVPTALAFVLVILAFRSLLRRPGALSLIAFTLASGAALLTRFSALQLAPVILALAVWRARSRRLVRPAWAMWGLVAAAVGGLALLDLGYLGQVSFLPLGQRALSSHAFQVWAHRLPWLRLPLPDAYIAGLDYLREITESQKPVYLLGASRLNSVWYYFPVAMAVKWPLGLLGLLLVRLVHALRHRARDAWDEACVLIPGLVTIAVAMSSDLDFGVRYLIPALPFLCVWIGGLLSRGAAWRDVIRPSRRWATLALALVLFEAGECALSTPWQLSFFNALAGGHGDRIVNDSNVDWGQGLIALRDELRARGIQRVYLAYHGTTDPAVYGIDYVPYFGGLPGPESDWLAVSSYFFVGLPQRMVTPTGDSPYLKIDFRAMESLEPVALPAHCMYLFRFRPPAPR